MKIKVKTYQIDQSGKIEQTERNTVIALVNRTEFAAILKKAEKRELQRVFKTLNMQRFFPTLTFSALIALILHNVSLKNKVTIDKEYFGHEQFIEKHVIVYLEFLGTKMLPTISFGHVGKLSNAHQYAYQVAVGKKKANLVVTKEQILKILFGTKNRADNRLTQECIPGDRRSSRLKTIYHYRNI